MSNSSIAGLIAWQCHVSVLETFQRFDWNVAIELGSLLIVMLCFVWMVDWLSPENISKKRHKTSSRAKNQQRPSPIVSQLHKHLLVGSLRGFWWCSTKSRHFWDPKFGWHFWLFQQAVLYKTQKWQSTVAGSFKVWMMSWKPCYVALLHITCIYSNITNITLKLWIDEEALQQGWRK